MTTLKEAQEKSPIVEAIYRHHERTNEQRPSNRLGASAIGKPCPRYLWYCFRQCCMGTFSGRMLRLFETGDLAESRFTAELRAIGCTVHDVDANGQQFSVSAVGGHFFGYMDAAILGVPGAEKTWHVGEYKTHSAKSFAKLVSQRVQKAKPEHYGQMQAYMHESGMKRALYLAVNKDTDELYAERVKYDKQFACDLETKAEWIITTQAPPDRLSDRPDFWMCRYCDAKTLCHGTGDVALPLAVLSCRQCCHSKPTMDGEAAWVCEKHGRGLSKEDQARTCSDHIVLPGLMHGCEVESYQEHDDGSGRLELRRTDGELWTLGQKSYEYTTRELMTLPASAIGAKGFVSAAKTVFGATAEGSAPDGILERYPEDTIVWRGVASEVAPAWRERYKEDLDLGGAIATVEDVDYCAAEFTGGRVLTHKLPGSKNCEIRERK